MAATIQQTTAAWGDATEKLSVLEFFEAWHEMDDWELWWVSLEDVEKGVSGEIGFRADYVLGEHLGRYIVLDPDGNAVDSINVRNASTYSELKEYIGDVLLEYQTYN
jgi:hypothetical protein